MQKKGFLNDAQFHVRRKTSLCASRSKSKRIPSSRPKPFALCRRCSMNWSLSDPARGGFTITTTIDPTMQAAARKSVLDALVAYDKTSCAARSVEVHGLRRSPRRTSRAIRRTPCSKARPRSSRTRRMSASRPVRTMPPERSPCASALKNGFVKLADYTRYNPQKLAPSAFAPPGTKLRVSLLTPPAPSTPVPLRLELDRKARSLCSMFARVRCSRSSATTKR